MYIFGRLHRDREDHSLFQDRSRIHLVATPIFADDPTAWAAPISVSGFMLNSSYPRRSLFFPYSLTCTVVSSNLRRWPRCMRCYRYLDSYVLVSTTVRSRIHVAGSESLPMTPLLKAAPAVLVFLSSCLRPIPAPNCFCSEGPPAIAPTA